MTEKREDKYIQGLARLYARLGFQDQKCPICAANGRDGTMGFRYSVIQQVPIVDAVILKCNVCKFCACFGLPMSREEFEKERSERNGTWFTPYWKDGCDPEQIIVDRLIQLGYIEDEYRRGESGG